LKVGIVGFGSIGTEVARAIIKGVEDFSLFGVYLGAEKMPLKRISNLTMKLKFMI
jgi:glyceraldehyde-3-phosphate dehydrogenase/erythrose-4-phosphate dehydrogenase